MFKRLRAPTGELADINSNRADDRPDKIVRSAILIHSGPNGSKTRLQSSDGEIVFDESRIRAVIAAQNKKLSELAAQYGGFDKLPMGANVPVLDQHNDDSNDRIRGRLTGLLRFEKRDVPKVGKNVSCAVADLTFLGADTVSKVHHGLIYHLSIGVDERTNTLGEVSCVIEPAAPGAMVLSKSKLKRTKRMSKENLAKLAAIKAELATLNDKTGETKTRVHLARRKTEVSSRFVKLMADKKMTPAEFKKIDVKRLAKLDKTAFEDVMHIYDARESVLASGQQGSTLAANFTDVGMNSEECEVKRLKAQAKKSMAKTGVKFLSKADDDQIKELSLEQPAQSDLQAGGQDQDEQESGVQDLEEITQQVEENATQIARVASMVEAIVDQLGASDDDEGDESEKEQEDQGDDVKPDEAELAKDDSDDKKDENQKDLEKDKEDDKKEESN